MPRTVQAETDRGPISLTLEYVKNLGRGRGARVDLVRDASANHLIAEKVFGFGRGLSSLITNTLYRLCYQAPFPYRTTASAVWTAYYRRKAIRLLTEYWFGAPCVADALYVRWDAEAKAFILGTEFVVGRGPRVDSPTSYTCEPRRQAGPLPPEATEQMDALVVFMGRLRSHLRESGFIGTQWQMDPGTLVATANLLYDGTRWIAVDLESGVPALTMPRYLGQGIRLGRVPLFDDTDFATLWAYVDRHADGLTQRLGPAKLHFFRHVIKELEMHERLWKTGEVAFFREPQRWMHPDGRAHIRQHTLGRWVQEGRISPEAAGVMETCTLRFLGYWAFGGVINRARRSAMFVHDREYRATVVAPYVAAIRSARLVRFLRDPQYCMAALKSAYLALADERYQLDLAERFIARRIAEWECAHRLTAEESDVLRRAVASRSAQEYVRGFGAHLALKALLPSLLLDPLFIGSVLTTGSIYPLALVFIRSLAITAYTLTRWIKRPDLRFGTALAIGLVPKLGILAYPSQLFTVHPELASFLVRDLASRMGEHLPIYGGRHTLTEHYCIRCADRLLAGARGLTRFLGDRLTAASGYSKVWRWWPVAR